MSSPPIHRSTTTTNNTNTTTTVKDQSRNHHHQGYSQLFTSSNYRNVSVSNSHQNLFTTVIVSFVVIVILLLTTNIYSLRTGSSHNLSTMTEQTPTTTNTSSNKPFSLMVQLTFTELQYQQQFLKDITPLCQYIKEHESTTTIAYEILLSDQDPLRVLIVERYVDKEQAFLQIHKTSAAFLEFRTKLQTMQQNQYVTVDGSSYYDSGIGYIHQ